MVEWLFTFSATLVGAFLGCHLFLWSRDRRTFGPKRRTARFKLRAGDRFASMMKDGIQLTTDKGMVAIYDWQTDDPAKGAKP